MIIICIDPGHGGTDCGASSKSNVKEKDINLSVGTRLKEIIDKNAIDANAVMTRTNDSYKSLNERVEYANSINADVFISIHHNAYNGNVEGYEVIHTIHHGDGEQLAKEVANQFNTTGQKARGKGIYSKGSSTRPGHDYYYVIDNTDMPCIITEYAYMDNPIDMAKIDEDVEWKLEAEVIFKALCNYYNIATKTDHWAKKYYDILIKGEGCYSPMALNKPTDFNKPVTLGELFAFECKRRNAEN